MPVRLPVVLTRSEVARVLHALERSHRLFGELLYGTGLRIMEAARLRVKDIDLARRAIVVRNGKGGKDRITVLPERLVHALRMQLRNAEELHARDLRAGFGAVWLPQALERKYASAARDWCWQYVFPADRRSVDPMVYTHVLNRGGRGVVSPLDRLTGS